MPAQTASTILIESALPQHHAMTQCDKSTLRYFDKACGLVNSPAAKIQQSNRQITTQQQQTHTDTSEKTKHGNVREAYI